MTNNLSCSSIPVGYPLVESREMKKSLIVTLVYPASALRNTHGEIHSTDIHFQIVDSSPLQTGCCIWPFSHTACCVWCLSRMWVTKFKDRLLDGLTQIPAFIAWCHDLLFTVYWWSTFMLFSLLSLYCSSVLSYSDNSRVYTVTSSSHTRCQSDPYGTLLPEM